MAWCSPTLAESRRTSKEPKSISCNSVSYLFHGESEADSGESFDGGHVGIKRIEIKGIMNE